MSVTDERIAAAARIVEARGFLKVRPGPAADSEDAALARFREVADALDLEVEELEDGSLIAKSSDLERRIASRLN